MDQDLTKLCAGFSKLKREQRLGRLIQAGLLDREDLNWLNSGGQVDFGLAENLIENAVGFFQIPMGVATNFRIDGADYVIPMAVEETSIIAAASKTAKWVRDEGSITTKIIGKNIIGQVQLAKVKNPTRAKSLIENQKNTLIKIANEVASGIVRRGGGVNEIQVRLIDRGESSNEKMIVVHIYADTCDAMGANIMNQICEALKHPIEEITGERVSMCILSNLVDTKLTKVVIEIPKIDPKLGEGIAEASLFSQLDPYRAATNNKGVMNGIDAILIATGNDWRAVEAGVHSFASLSGKYKSITNWTMEQGTLIGIFEAPIIVGTVGGVTSLHPAARMSMKMMRIKSSDHLSRILGAVGLVQNLGALRALSTIGVVQGHMKLHAANLALAAGARAEEIPSVQRKLEELLRVQRRVSLSHAIEILKRVRLGPKDENSAPVFSS